MKDSDPLPPTEQKRPQKMAFQHYLMMHKDNSNRHHKTLYSGSPQNPPLHVKVQHSKS